MSDAAGDPYKRAELIKDIVKSISVIPEAIVRSEYIKECSQMLHVEERILVAKVAELIQEKATSPQGGKAATNNQGEDKARTQENSGSPENLTDTENPESTGNSGAPQSANIPQNWDNEKAPLYPKELLIVQQLIRHGEKVIYQEEKEDGNIEIIRVAEFVVADLAQDTLTFTTPLFRQLLDELMLHLHDEGFSAERHFIAHANPEYSKLAADLAEDKYQLSKYHSKTQTVINEAERLHEIVPHLLIDYKMAIVEMELKETLNQLRQPSVASDPTLCAETMARYKQLMEIKQQMAKQLGDRVIGT